MAYQDQEKNRDARIAATSRIWGFATVMLGICIPLSAVTRHGAILPIAVISGAAIGTGAVWQSSDKKSQNSLLQPSKVNELEERIANLETIAAESDELDLHKRIKQLESNKLIKRRG